MKWIALKDESNDRLRTLRLFDNDGKAVAFVEPAEDDFTYEARVEGDFGQDSCIAVTRQKFLGQYRDLVAAVRAVHRVFKLPEFKDPKEIAGDFEPVDKQPGGFFYGGGGTIHDCGEVNVERDPVTGEVVAVWFRCMMLPFTDSKADAMRSTSMRRRTSASLSLGAPLSPGT